MALVPIDSTASHNGGSEAATPAMDTSGANLLVCMYFTAVGVPTTISDSKSNTWSYETPIVLAGTYELHVAYCEGTPTVGSGHTFTMSGLGASYLGVIAFSGAPSSGSFLDLVGDFAGPVNTVQPGSLTPSENNAVLISWVMGFGDAPSGLSINSGFTEVEDVVDTGGANNQLGLAHKIQTTAGAENPTWTASGWTNATMFVSMAAFKAAAAAGLSVLPFRTNQAIRRAASY